MKADWDPDLHPDEEAEFKILLPQDREKWHMKDLHPKFGDESGSVKRVEKGVTETEEVLIPKMVEMVKTLQDSKKVECPHCVAKFENKGDLQFHFRHNHEDKKAKCNICGNLYISGESLTRHLKTKHRVENTKLNGSVIKPITCSKCHHVLTSHRTYQRHMKEQHSDQPKIVCPECGQEYHNNFSLKRHLKNQHQKT
eukprot:Platyproteum_vivax@DN7514_c0_g1_i11.p1